MAALSVTLPDSLKTFVDRQVDAGSFDTSSEYVRHLICREQDRHALRELLLDGARSRPTQTVNENYFKGLRRRASIDRTA